MRRAFTLIEVLIGILILAIALLGLGAVVPVVVRAQRNAADATAGIGALATAESYLRGSAELNRLTRPGTSPPVRVGLGVWLLDPNWSPANTTNVSYLWEPMDAQELSAVTGEVTLQQSTRYPTALRVADRLYPARNSASTGPQFVWDLIARRLPTADGEPMRLQAAIFLRRLDAGIRVPDGSTLYDVVTGNVGSGAARKPVGADAQGYPTGNGTGDYSGVQVMPAEFRLYAQAPGRRDLLTMVSPTQVQRTLARQPGQRLVDNLGNVYTVLGLWEGGTDVLLIDPPVPTGVPDTSMNAPVARELRQVAFTPQVPVGVRVVTLTPQNSK